MGDDHNEDGDDANKDDGGDDKSKNTPAAGNDTQRDSANRESGDDHAP